MKPSFKLKRFYFHFEPKATKHLAVIDQTSYLDSLGQVKFSPTAVIDLGGEVNAFVTRVNKWGGESSFTDSFIKKYI